jgi:hypothetical protein
VLTDRLREVLADCDGSVGIVRIVEREIRAPVEAVERGMTGSPTLLVDGTDPFAVAGQLPSLSCRLYADDGGRLTGAPSLAQLRAVIAKAADGSARGHVDPATSRA